MQQMSLDQATNNLKNARGKKKKGSTLKSIAQKDEQYDVKKEFKEMSEMIEKNEHVRKMVYDSARKYDMIKDF